MLYCICYALSTEWREQMIEEHRDVMMENYQEKYKKELYQQEIIEILQVDLKDLITDKKERLQ